MTSSLLIPVTFGFIVIAIGSVCFPSLRFAGVCLSIPCIFVGGATFLGLEFFLLVLQVGMDLWVGLI